MPGNNWAMSQIFRYLFTGMKWAPICISQSGHVAAPHCLEGAGKSSANASRRGTYLLSKGKKKKSTRRRGQTVKGLSSIHLLTCSRCAWLMSSSFGGEHMSTAAVPPSMGGDCAQANCIPGSPAKSEPSELSRFLRGASAFHLIYMSHPRWNQRPSAVRTNRWLPGLMRSSYRFIYNCALLRWQKVWLCFHSPCWKRHRSDRLKGLWFAKELH